MKNLEVSLDSFSNRSEESYQEDFMKTLNSPPNIFEHPI